MRTVLEKSRTVLIVTDEKLTCERCGKEAHLVSITKAHGIGHELCEECYNFLLKYWASKGLEE